MGDVVLTELSLAGAEPIITADLVRARTGELRFQFRRSNGSFKLRALWKSVKSAFLPEGYPHSVTADYVHFQTWDTLQGLSTYVRSMLSTQVKDLPHELRRTVFSLVHKREGTSGRDRCGETTATVVGATFQWFLRDFTGMLGGILFTLVQGSNLDSNAKQWRLAADFLNDMGMLMDLVSPLFPGSFLVILCLGSIARSITGVASGATRAALTQHFALRQNAADISAKEGSQETAATMVGMLLGIVLARVTAGNNFALWASFLLLTGFHMFANYQAVRSLCLTSLNPTRVNFILKIFTSSGQVPSPQEVSSKERVLPWIYVLWPLNYLKPKRRWKLVLGSSGGMKVFDLETVFDSNLHACVISADAYLVAVEERTIHVVLHRNFVPEDSLRSYVHGLYLKETLKRSAREGGNPYTSTDAAEIESIAWMKTTYGLFLAKMKNSGWNVDRVYISAGEWRVDWPQHQTS